jgi:dolichol-phosphate mannosyltransferase
MLKLSIIIPVYFNQDNLLPLYNDIREKVLMHLDVDYEIIFVDDGSKDNSYAVMQELARLDSHIILVRLSRNFGEHAAILAGLSKCTGDCAVRKAADLQEPSELILQLLASYQQGNKVVLATRADRDEPATQKAFSNLYAYIMQKVALPTMPKGGFDSFLIDRQIIDLLVDMKEKNTSLMGQVLWSGFQTASVPYTRLQRKIGTSKWTFSKKIKLAMDSLVSFSSFPLKMVSAVGFITFLAALIMLFATLYRRLAGIITEEGYASLLIIILMGFGLVMLSIGIIGEYIWRIYDATRKRPPFIIDESYSKDQ